MKNRVKSLLWLLMLGIATSTLVESCQKEPVDPCCETTCNLRGYIAYESFGCVTPPTGDIGIMGEDGIFYRIKKDHTGQFSNYPVGTYVSFGLCHVKDVDPGDVHTMLIWSPPVKEGDLGCIEEIRKPDEGDKCDQMAEVVAVSYQQNVPPTEGRYLKINGLVYAVGGDLADAFQNYLPGTSVMVSVSYTRECFLPTVITYPDIAGCVELKCITPLNITY